MDYSTHLALLLPPNTEKNGESDPRAVNQN